MTHELYRKHRPKKLDGLVGQSKAVAVLNKLIAKGEVPHVILMTGPSGVGKTTAARALRREVGCGLADFIEVNAASSRGIDMVREIQQHMGLSPRDGVSRVWLIDEVQKATSDAQSAFLKILEDTPAHVYFFLATTDPHKLLPTIRSRCTEIKFQALNPTDMQTLLESICQKEAVKVSIEVLEKIIEAAEGGARKALVILNQIIGLATDDERMEAVQSADTKKAAIDLARAIIKPNAKWPDVAKLIKDLEEDPEGLRRMILGYAASVALGGGALAGRAYNVLCAFEGNFFDSGKGGLVRAAWEVIHSK